MNTTITPEALQRAMDAACKAGEYAELPTRVYDALIEGWYALQERPVGPSYEALDIIARSVAGALERAGVTDCDDPGEAIDVLRERYERRIADLHAAPAAAGVPDAVAWHIQHLDGLVALRKRDSVDQHMIEQAAADGVVIRPLVFGDAAGQSAAQPQAEQHPDDAAVDRFAAAMKEKLAAARANGRGGSEDPARCTAADLSRMLREHVAKGDPRDVANFCMMLHQRGESIVQAEQQGVPELFVQWLEREMPAGTVIGRPAWWAPKLVRALRNAERGVLGGCNG